MKVSLPLVLGLFSTITVGCSNSSPRSYRSQAADSKSEAVLSVSAGIHDGEVKEANTEETEAKVVSKSTEDEILTVTTKTPVQSPHQSPSQSPHQSPTQSPTQSPIEIPGVTIKDFSYAGSGCPEDSVASNISPDAKAFTLLFDSFFVEAVPTGKASSAIGQTSCSIKLTLLAPAGWQVALLSVDYRGFADLAEGDSAVISENLRFAGSSTTAAFTSKIEGQLSDNFQLRSETLLKTAQWSSCEGVEKTLHMDLSATVKATTDATASLSLDSVDGELSYKSGMIWRRCH